jgi:hypothetical protein
MQEAGRMAANVQFRDRGLLLRRPHLQEVEEERDKQKKGADWLPFSSPE